MTSNIFKQYKLSPEILKALTSLDYSKPTEVQAKVIPSALDKKDLVVKSQTGSGKTAAYGIPLCELVEWNENKPQALVLTPTRELALQVNDDMTNIGRFKRIKSTVVYGKSPFHIQKAELKQRTHIVVGTPGRVLDHIERGTLALDKLQYLVIDEADEMLNMGFIEQVTAIIEKLPKARSTMLFSATFPDDVAQLASRYMHTPIQIEIEAKGLTTSTIKHAVVKTAETDKLDVLQNMLIVENPDSCIIFCNTQDKVEQVYRKLKQQKFPTARIHGGMEQDERFAVMKGYRAGTTRFLVATDVAARGIDVSDITHVFNVDIPLDKDSYVHRTGRTGRAGKSGYAYTFVTARDERILADIERYIGFEIETIPAPLADDVEAYRSRFEKRLQRATPVKVDKRDALNEQIMKLNFNAGKKKKLRAVDFVGTIAKLEGVTADDIGIITIQDNVTDVEILNGKGALVLQLMQDMTIKGKPIKVRRAKRS